jgi:hypothetical protein
MSRFLDWIDRHAAIFVIVGLLCLAVLSVRVYRDERDTKASAAHTRLVQKAGEPVGRCLLEALEAVAPLLLKVPSAEKPLDAYIRLQSARYRSAPCPDY